MDYWKECVESALEEAGLTATPEQVKTMTDVVSGAHEQYGMAFGHDCIPNPLKTELENEKRKRAKAIAEEEARSDLFKRAYASAIGVEPSRIYVNHGDIYIGRT